MKTTEEVRQEVQRHIDDSKVQEERNRLGQFATESKLAQEMLAYASQLVPANQAVNFLDPAFGTGVFYSALLKTISPSRIEGARAFEIDSTYATAAKRLWSTTPLNLEHADFTHAGIPKETDRYNLVICNPPYVRHHHIRGSEKVRLQNLANHFAGVSLSGLSGLYCYFLCISHPWMAPGAIAGWLIPSEFMDVNYGREVKRYLLERVTLLRVHRFDPEDTQFKDAYVSSAIVWLRNVPPSDNTQVEFTYGGTLTFPSLVQTVSTKQLKITPKWTAYPHQPGKSLSDPHTRLSDFFEVKRGVATGSNEFFIMSTRDAEERGLPAEFLRPILPPPRVLETEWVEADETGEPLVRERLVLLDCSLSEETIRINHPALWSYLQKGRRAKIDQTYLCRHRMPWYSQERRVASPFLCTYLGRKGTKRGRPFRFVLNFSKATATNVWLMLYPREIIEQRLNGNRALAEEIWRALSEISPDDLLSSGRVYGGGLYKLEPSELGNVPADSVDRLVESR
jgi:predicted RNA methylase